MLINAQLVRKFLLSDGTLPSLYTDKSLTLNPVLSQINPVLILTSYLSRAISIRAGFLNCVFPLEIPIKIL